MLLLVGAETLQNTAEKSAKASLIQLHFGVADIWCCLGVTGAHSGKGAEATERVQHQGRSGLIN